MADRKELEIDGKPLSSLRVVDLKMELEKRGMSKSGSKKDLSDRLKMQLQLEKLHESASTDEGHVPNLRLQDDEIAEHSDIIKDYLAKQQQIYEMRKEAIRRVELEERARDSEASAGDTSQEEEDLEQNRRKADESCGLDLTIATQIKVAAAEESVGKEETDKVCGTYEARDAVEHKGSELGAEFQKEPFVGIAIPEAEVARPDDVSMVFHEMAAAEVHPPSEVMSRFLPVDSTVIENPEMDSSEIAAAVFGIERSVASEVYFQSQEEQNATVSGSVTATPVAEAAPAADEISMTDRGGSIGETGQSVGKQEGVVDSTVLEFHSPAASGLTSAPEKVKQSPENKDASKTEAAEGTSETAATKTISSHGDPGRSWEQQVETQMESNSSPVVVGEHKAVETAKGSERDENRSRSPPPPRHRPRLKRRSDWGFLTAPSVADVRDDKRDDSAVSKEAPEKEDHHSSKDETAASERVVEGDDKEERNEDVATERSRCVKSPKEKEGPKKMDSNGEQASEKTEEEDTRDGDNSQRSPSRDSSEYERPSRNRRRSRRSSTESSSSSKSSSGSRSRSWSSDSDSSRSASRSQSRSRSRTPSPKVRKNASFTEESMETNGDSASRQSPKPIEEKTEAEEEKMDVDESLATEVAAPAAAALPAEGVGGGLRQTKVLKASEAVQAQEGPVKISSRKISLSSSKEKRAKDGEGNGVEGGEGEKPQRKRRWGGSGAVAVTDGKKLSLSISTDSLKGLIPDVKPLAVLNSGLGETLLELSNDGREAPEPENVPAKKEDAPEVAATPPVSAPSAKHEAIIYRTVTQVVKDKSSEAVDKEPKKGKRLILRNSTSITLSEDKSTARRSPSPPRYPPSCIIHLRNLVRPYTLNQLKELLAKTGVLVEGGFWIDKIKSKCYVTYELEEQAVTTRQALHGAQWPSSNPKHLIVDFASQDELEFHRSLTDAPEAIRMLQTGANESAKPDWPPSASPPPVPRPKPSMAANAEPPGRQQRESRRSERAKDKKEPPRHNSIRALPGGVRPEKGSLGKERDRDRSKGKEREVAAGARQPPVREWDRDKIGEKSPGERARAARSRNRMSPSRSRSRSRGGLGARRSPPLLNDGFGGWRERERDRARGVEVRDRRDRKDRRKEEEEAPAKLLDDLFRKTKATPCIYWLPLTAEQINAKEEERRQRQVEREKRRQLEQAERDRNGNANVEPNKRNRERQEDGRNRRRSASPIRSRARRR